MQAEPLQQIWHCCQYDGVARILESFSFKETRIRTLWYCNSSFSYVGPSAYNGIDLSRVDAYRPYGKASPDARAMPPGSNSNVSCLPEAVRLISMQFVSFLRIINPDWHIVTISARHRGACTCLHFMSMHHYLSPGCPQTLQSGGVGVDSSSHHLLVIRMR